MPLARLILILAALAAPASFGLVGPAAAQDYLSRAEIEAYMREAAFCYHPDDRFACAWAEIYTEFNEDHTILQSAAAVWGEPMEVLEFRINWVGDALCIPYEDQGLRAIRQAQGYRFPFDLSGLEPQAPELIPQRIEQFRAESPREFCFRYSIDEAGPDALFQHVFRDGVQDVSLDPIALIPLFARGVAISPSG